VGVQSRSSRRRSFIVSDAVTIDPRARLPYVSRGRSASHSQTGNAMWYQAPPLRETDGAGHGKVQVDFSDS
jgi:hypothetical protein